MANGFAILQQLVSNIALENIREQQRLRDPLTQLRLAQARKALEQGDIELGLELEEAQRKRAAFPLQQEQRQATIESTQALAEQRISETETPEELEARLGRAEVQKQAGRETLAKLRAGLRTVTEKKDQKSKTLGNLTANQMLLEKQRLKPIVRFTAKGEKIIEPQSPAAKKRTIEINSLEKARRLGLNDLDLEKANLVEQDVLDYFDVMTKIAITFKLKDKEIVKMLKAGIKVQDFITAIDSAVKRTGRTPQEAIKHLLSRL